MLIRQMRRTSEGDGDEGEMTGLEERFRHVDAVQLVSQATVVVPSSNTCVRKKRGGQLRQRKSTREERKTNQKSRRS